jgi:hypothetical protein
MPETIPRDVETFTADNRMSLEQLYVAYDKLLEAGWSKELIAVQKETLDDGRVVDLPIYAYKSHTHLTKPIRCLWALGGVHGEEPAGSNAFAKTIPTLIEYAQQGIPIVLLPVLNPSGYHRDWRYPNVKRGFSEESATDSRHLIPNSTDPSKPMFPEPSSETADQITKWVLEQSKSYLPLLVFDHHEDEADTPGKYNTCVFYHGNPTHLKLAEYVVEILRKAHLPIISEGKTVFGTTSGQTIHNGIVISPPDGSIDDLLASDVYFRDGEVKEKFSSTVIVVETGFDPSDQKMTLQQRVNGHILIIKIYGDLWEKLKKLQSNELSSS